MVLSGRNLAVLWLVGSAEVFATAKRIEWGLPGRYHRKESIPPGEQDTCTENSRSSQQGLSTWRHFTRGLLQSKPSLDVCEGSSDKRDCDDIMTVRGGHSSSVVGPALPVSLSLFKLILQLLLTGLNIACWLIPMRMKRFSQNKELISLANAFSGGVFLSLAFGHMLPHSLHGFEKLNLPHNLPFFVSLGGYLLIFFVEKIAFNAHGLMEGEHHAQHHIYGAPDVDSSKAVNGLKDGVGILRGSPVLPAPHKHRGGHTVAVPASNSGRSAVVLLLALGIHSIFETMALGLSDTPVQAGLLATSIALHQPAESIALLVAFLKSGMPKPDIFRYLLGFSFIGVIGVVLGLVVNNLASEIWDSVFVALASGTFIYVGCTEIVAEEFEEDEGKWKKFAALLAGVAIVGGITVVTEKWEGH